MTAPPYLDSITEAVDYYVVAFKPPEKKVTGRYRTNGGRHICLTYDDGTADYVLFKRQPFLDYRRKTEDGELYDSLNTDVVAMLLRAKTPTSLIYAYPNGSVYTMSAKKLRHYVNEIRLTNASAESTVVFPVSAMTQLLTHESRRELNAELREEDIADAKTEYYGRKKGECKGK